MPWFGRRDNRQRIGSVGLDLKIVKFTAGANVEVGQTFSVGARRYSPLKQFRQGETFDSKISDCRRFAKEIRDTDSLNQELNAAVQVRHLPESPCYRDFDCRKEVKLGLLMSSVVATCIPSPSRERATCEPRYVNTPGATCSLPGEGIYHFRYYCASGLTCDRKSRQCLPVKTDAQWLTQAGIAEAKPAGLAVSYLAVGSPMGESDGSAFCANQGLKGWKLPAPEQLKDYSHIGKLHIDSAAANIAAIVERDGGEVAGRMGFEPPG